MSMYEGPDDPNGDLPDTRPVDGQAFRHALSRFASGVTVVTTRSARGERVGATISAFCSLSLEPPLVLFCITTGSETLAAVQDSRRFVVNVLEEHQEPVSRLFSAQTVDWTAADFADGDGGIPRLKNCIAHIDARVEAIHPGGDHAIVVGLVVKVDTVEGRPLIHHRSAYSRLIDIGPQR